LDLNNLQPEPEIPEPPVTIPERKIVHYTQEAPNKKRKEQPKAPEVPFKRPSYSTPPPPKPKTQVFFNSRGATLVAERSSVAQVLPQRPPPHEGVYRVEKRGNKLTAYPR
jgi:hypothetical protein